MKKFILSKPSGGEAMENAKAARFFRPQIPPSGYLEPSLVAITDAYR